MKILLATPLYPPQIGGPATYAKLLYDHLPSYGDTVTIVPFSSVQSFPPVVRHFLFFVKIITRARKHDVIFAQDVFSVGFPALIAAKLTRKPFIVRVPGDFAWEQARVQYGISDTVETFQQKKYPLKIRLYRFVERLIVRSASVVMTPSDYFSSIVAQWGSAVRPITIYNGIDLKRIASCAAEKKLTKDFSIIAAGRMVPWKGFDLLVDLLVYEPSWRLTLVGDGPERQKLEQQARKIGVGDRVSFLGPLEQRTLWQTISLHDVFVLSSSFESFSYQVVEVMALGVPIVATEGSNLKEIITNEKEGILVSSGDKSAFLQALKRIEKDESLRQIIVNAAKQRSTQFSIEETIHKLKNTIAFLQKPKHLVFLGTDRSLFDRSSRSYDRISSYGGLADYVSIVVTTPREKGFGIIKKDNITIIPTRSVSRIFYPFSLFFKTLFLKPKVTTVSPQDPAIVGFVGWLISLCTGARLSLQFHTDIFSQWYGTTFMKKAEQRIARFLILRADAIRVVSQKIAGSFPKRLQTSVSVIPIFHQNEHVSMTAHQREQVFTFVAISRFEKEKNIEGLLDAFAIVLKSFPDTKLVLVGKGSLETSLKERAYELGIKDNVVFEGWMSDPSIWYFKAQVFVQNSFYEGYGLSLVEALSAGCPSITTRVGIAEELIHDQKNSFLCNIGEPEQLAKKMLVARQNPELLERIRQELTRHPIVLPYSTGKDYLTSLRHFYE